MYFPINWSAYLYFPLIFLRTTPFMASTSFSISILFFFSLSPPWSAWHLAEKMWLTCSCMKGWKEKQLFLSQAWAAQLLHMHTHRQKYTLTHSHSLLHEEVGAILGKTSSSRNLMPCILSQKSCISHRCRLINLHSLVCRHNKPVMTLDQRKLWSVYYGMCVIVLHQLNS